MRGGRSRCTNSEEWKKTTDELIALQAQLEADRGPCRAAIPTRSGSVSVPRATSSSSARRRTSRSVDGQYEENLVRRKRSAGRNGRGRRQGGRLRDDPRVPASLGRDRFRAHQAEGRDPENATRPCVDKLFNTLRGSERDRSMWPLPREGLVASRRRATAACARNATASTTRCVSWSRTSASLENNIGFFAKSKNAEALIADVRAKIERATRGDGRRRSRR